jgi:hypothetical protein
MLASGAQTREKATVKSHDGSPRSSTLSSTISGTISGTSTSGSTDMRMRKRSGTSVTDYESERRKHRGDAERFVPRVDEMERTRIGNTAGFKRKSGAHCMRNVRGQWVAYYHWTLLCYHFNGWQQMMQSYSAPTCTFYS